MFGKWSRLRYMDQCTEAFGIVKVLTDQEGKPSDLEIVYANTAMASVEKVSAQTMQGRRFSERHPEVAGEWAAMLYPAAYQDHTVKRKNYLNGPDLLAVITGFPVEKGFCGVLLQDYTALVGKMIKSISSKEVGIFYYDIRKDLVIADASMIARFGGKPRYEGLITSYAMEMIDETYVDLLRSQLSQFPEPSRLIEANLRLKNGRLMHFALTADDMEAEETIAIGYVEDVSNAPTFAQQEEQDTLTGLFHSRSAKVRINEAIGSCLENNRIDAMILIDLDGFALVNEVFGHEKGDEILKETAEILRNNFKGKDILARPGGDEYIVYVTDLNDKRAALQICRSLNKLIAFNLDHDTGDPVRVTASIGVGFACDNGGNYDRLYKNVEDAVKETKANGKNGYTLA